MRPRSMLVVFGVSAIILSQSLSAALGADWPQWRGPQRDGISAETGLLKQWPDGGPKLVWQAKDLGDGYSTPAVVGDRLYLLSNKGLDDERVESMKAADGSIVWTTTIGKVGEPKQKPSYPAARSTPTVDGDVLYALGSDGDLTCLETSGGKERWHKSLRRDFGGEPGVWAYSESPLIDGDKLICTPGGPDATMVALNKTSGEVIWKMTTPDVNQAGYASAIIVETGGVKQYVQFLQKELVGVDAKTGKLLWSYDKTAHGSMANIPTPVEHDGFVYSAAGRTGGGLVQLKAADGQIETKPVYFSAKLPSAIGGTVLVDGYLYGANSQGLQCVEFSSGKVQWQDRSVGAGAVLWAEGRLYVHGENGEVALVEAAPDAYHERGRFTPPGAPEHRNGKAWAYPVVANGRLYIREGAALWCYNVKAE